MPSSPASNLVSDSGSAVFNRISADRLSALVCLPENEAYPPPNPNNLPFKAHNNVQNPEILLEHKPTQMPLTPLLRIINNKNSNCRNNIDAMNVETNSNNSVNSIMNK